MKLTYLGTAAAEGWPAAFCNCDGCRAARRLGGRNIHTRSQALVDDALLLDFPCDAWLHALRQGLDFSAVRWLLVTHSHTDHFYPAELVNRGGCYSHGMKSPTLDIFCNEAVRDYFYKAAGHELVPDVEQRLRFHIVRPFECVSAGPYRVTPLPAKHMDTEQALFYLIEREGRSLLYAHDTGRFYPEVYEFLAGRAAPLSAVSLDSTSGRFENGENDGHMGLPDAAAVRLRLLEAGAAGPNTRFIANHFSHNGGWLHDEFARNAAPYQIEPAYDGMTVEL